MPPEAEQTQSNTNSQTGDTPAEQSAKTGANTTSFDFDALPEPIKKRIKRADGRAVADFVASLGYDSPDALKAVVEVERQKTDAAKSAEQKLAEITEQHKSSSELNKRLLKLINERIEHDIEAIPEVHRETAAALLDAVGDDPEKRLEVLQKLQPLFASGGLNAVVKPAAPKIDARAGQSTGIGTTTISPEEEARIAREYGGMGLR